MDWKVNLNQSIVPQMRERAAAGLNAAAALVHNRAQQRAPKDEGTLRRSAAVIPATPENLRAGVVFDTPYATRQHEELSYHHTEGQAKYLESAMNESVNEARAIISNAVNGGRS